MKWNKYKLVKNSKLFDEDYYLSTYDDVKKAGIDPIKHYLKYGWKEGRNPSDKFGTNSYLETYEDVKNAKMNPLVHFIKFGVKEGREAQNNGQVVSHSKRTTEKFKIALRLLKNKPILVKKVFIEIKTNGIKKTFNKIENKLKFQQYEQELLKNDISRMTSIKDMSKFTGQIQDNDKSVVFTVPCLSYGGGELYMLNLAKAIHMIEPSVKIFVIIPEFVGECRTDIQQSYNFIKFISIRDLVTTDDTLSSCILLKDLLLYIKPFIFHNINSSIAWKLVINESNELRFYINKLYACIFCEQYNKMGELEGFAKDYLESGIDNLDMLISDNTKFKDFASKTFLISKDNLEKFKVLYNPIKLDRSNIVDACRLKYFDLEHKLDFKKLLWIGRLDEQKNIKLVFEIALAKPEIEIHIFGSKLIDNTEFGVIPQNIIFKGLTFDIPNTIFSDDYSAFILTSKYEGLPNILIECGYLGIPIIVSNVGGVSDLINSNTGYLLSEHPKVDEYINAFQKIQSEPEIRIKKSQELIRLIEERHTLNYLVNEIKDLGYLSYENAHLQKLVSIIIPCYNQYEFLISCLESCYASYSGPIEILVIDDCSTDTKKNQFQFIINQIYPDVKFINNKTNIGLAATRNIGLQNATGEYIQFLDSDDILLPNKISNQLKFLNNFKNSENLIILSDYVFSNHDMSKISYESTIKQFEITLGNFLMHWERGFSIPIHTGLFPSSIVNYPFNEKLPAKEDWFFWINLLVNNYKFEFLDLKSLVYRMNGQSMTKSKFLMSGQAWINVSYFILEYLADKISRETKIDFLNGIVDHYKNWYLPNSINEITLKDDNINHIEIKTSTNEVTRDIVEIKIINISIKPMIDLTVLIPIFNHYDYLVECINSVLNQTVLPSEILLLNDNSSDIRVKILLKEYEETYKSIIKFIDFDKNIGISKIQNYGINIAKSKYIAFLDCDDYLELNAFENISEYINKDIDYIFTDNYHVYTDSKKRTLYGGYNNIFFSYQNNIKNDLLNGMVANHLKIIKVESLKACNLFDESVSGVQDWDLALKFCQKDFSFYYLSLPLYNHRIHKNSVTNSMRIIQFKLTNLVRRKNVVHRYPHLLDNSSNVVYIDHRCDLSKIHNYLEEKSKLVFILDENSTSDDYWFINEFNGFFDYVELNSVQYTYISGFLWDSKILKQQACNLK